MVAAGPNGGSAITGYAVLAYYTNGTYSGQAIIVCATCYTGTVPGHQPPGARPSLTAT